MHTDRPSYMNTTSASYTRQQPRYIEREKMLLALAGSEYLTQYGIVSAMYFLLLYAFVRAFF